MPLYIISIGVIILISAFSYSIFVIRNTSADALASREVLPNDEVIQVQLADGTYRSKVRYEVPSGYIEAMNLTVTIKEGIVTDSKVDSEIANPVSGGYIRQFEQYYKDHVLGKSIAEISLARVGGASLTNNAFDTALEKIKAQTNSGPTVTETKNETMPLMLPNDATMPQMVPNLAPKDTTALSPRPDFQLLNPVKIIRENNENSNTDSQYKDGTYIVELTYYAWPELYEPMQTSITLKDGIIVEAEQRYATIDYSHSINYQKHFDSLYKNIIIGLPLEDTPISRVGQATETTDGFNEALAIIKKESQK